MPRNFEKFLKLSGGWLSDEEKEKAAQFWPDRVDQIKSMPNNRLAVAGVTGTLEGAGAPHRAFETMPEQPSKPDTSFKTMEYPDVSPGSEIAGQQMAQMPLPEKTDQGYFGKLQRKVQAHQEMYKDKSLPEKIGGGLLRLPATLTLANKELLTKPQEAVPEFGKMLYHSGQDLASLIRYGVLKMEGSGVDPYTRKEAMRIAKELEGRPVERTLELSSLPLTVMPFVKYALKERGVVIPEESTYTPSKVQPRQTTDIPTKAEIQGLQENIAYASKEGLLDRPKTKFKPDVEFQRKVELDEMARNVPESQRTTFESQYRLDQKFLNDAKWTEKYGNWPRDSKTPPPLSPETYATFMGLSPESLGILGKWARSGYETASGAAKDLTSILSDVFVRTKKQVKTQEGRVLVSEMQDVIREIGPELGQSYTRLVETGIKKFSEKQLAELHNTLMSRRQISSTGKDIALDVLEERRFREKYPISEDLDVLSAADGIEKILDDFAQQAEDAGVKIKNPDGTTRPFTRAYDYVPRSVKQEVLDVVSKDINKVLKKAENMNDVQFENFIKRGIEGRLGFNEKTIEALGHVIETRGAVNMRDAVMFTFRRLYNESIVPMGNLERARILDFPASFYETNPLVYMAKYIKGATKRLAEVRKWGPDADGVMKKINKIAEKNIDESLLLEKMLEVLTGASEIKYAWGPKGKRFWDFYNSYEVLTKIGTGTATIPNMTQLLYSTFAKLGWYKSIRGIGRALTKEGWKNVKESGAIVADEIIHGSLNLLSGRDTGLSGRMGRLAELSLKASLFDAINRWNKAISASVGEIAIKDFHKIANKGKGIRAKLAQKELAEVGIDYTKPLTRKELLEGMYDYSQRMQLMKNPLEEPLLMNMPKTRPFFLFKRFGLKQAYLVKDMIVNDMIRNKNPLPFLRVIAGGIIGGEFVRWAKDEIREFLSGHKMPDIKENIWQHALNNLAAAGTIGMISDIFGREGDFEDVPRTVRGAVRAADFLLVPLPLSEINRWRAGIFKMIDYWDSQTKYTNSILEGAERTLKAAPSPVLQMVGSPLGRMLGERLKTQRQRENLLKMRYSDTRQRAMNYFIKGQNEKGIDLVESWNEAHPERPLKITVKDVRREMKRRRKEAQTY